MSNNRYIYKKITYIKLESIIQAYYRRDITRVPRCLQRLNIIIIAAILVLCRSI